MATTTLTEVTGAAWTDLGAGPLLIQAIEGDVRFAVADTQPAVGAAGFNLRPDFGPRDINTTSHIWAINNQVSGKAAIVTANVTS